eukprot:scaffold21979_cov66-Phaeocystis_antarctica.AAC.8
MLEGQTLLAGLVDLHLDHRRSRNLFWQTGHDWHSSRHNSGHGSGYRSGHRRRRHGTADTTRHGRWYLRRRCHLRRRLRRATVCALALVFGTVAGGAVGHAPCRLGRIASYAEVARAARLPRRERRWLRAALGERDRGAERQEGQHCRQR